MENLTKIVTGKVRFCYVNVFEPTAMNEGDTPKYNICILIPKDDAKTLEKINKAIEAAKQAGKAKLADKNGKIPSNLKLPLRDGDAERADDPAFENCYFINANSNRKPSIVDHDLNPIMEKEEFYSGCYGRASINFYAFSVSSKGIAAGLNNLQKLEDGEMLAGGSTAEEDFGGKNEWNDELM
jgi:conserved phage-associated protein|nr:MAG TPA: DNA helix destabilizing protein [Caudoviricetes sp.]